MEFTVNVCKVELLCFKGYWVAFDDPVFYPNRKHLGKLFGLHWFV